MLRVCVIGMGHIGNLHAKIYRERKDCELVAVCDRVLSIAEESGKRQGVKY